MRRALLGVAALAGLSGCAGWLRVTAPSDTTFAPRQQVQVWQGRQARVLHEVHLTPDSLIGVPFNRRADCDSCRVAVPRAAVDSLRLGDRETPALVLSVLPLAALIATLVALRGS